MGGVSVRADRLLSMVLLLQSRGRLTARDLAETLEVSERTVYRDLDALSAAGVPVYAERGRGGGCTLQEGYRTSLMGLSEAEVRTLFVAGVRGPLADLGLDEALERVLLKLLAALPSSHRSAAERARQRVHLDAAPWFPAHEPVPHLDVVQTAIWQEQKLRLEYRRGDGTSRRRLVEPYGLVAKASVWYLVAMSDGEMRAYRVSRIQAAELTGDWFERDNTFDLPSFWARWSADFMESLARYSGTARVAADCLNSLPRRVGEGLRFIVEEAGQPDAGGRRTLPMVFESLDIARHHILNLGSNVEVIEPPELRDSVAAAASEIAALYRGYNSTQESMHE